MYEFLKDYLEFRILRMKKAVTDGMKFHAPTHACELSAELERLTQKLNTATVNVRIADEIVRQAQSNMEDLQHNRVVAQGNLDLATQRWEQIRKQIIRP